MQLSPIGVADIANYTVYIANMSTVTYSVITSSVSATAAFSLFANNPTFIFAFINNVQALTYLPLTTVPLPEGLKARLVSMNLLNYFANLIDLSVEIESVFILTAPEFALNYGFGNAAFIANAGVILSSYAISLSLVPILWLLSKVKWPRIANIFRKSLAEYKWRNLIMQWVESYIDLCIACFIQLRVVIFKAGLP